MKYVNIDGMLDPREYEQRLPEFAGALPPGARAFAADPDHYDFVGKRCVKDLALERISYGQASLELSFRHNCWKHDDDLVIRYEGVFDLVIDVASQAYGGLRPVVILDEVLPHPDGYSHEIAFRPGTVRVLCRDLVATWVDSACPENPELVMRRPVIGGRARRAPVRSGPPEGRRRSRGRVSCRSR